MVNPNAAAASFTQSIHSAVPLETAEALPNDQSSQLQFRSPPNSLTSVPNTTHPVAFPPENLQAQQIHSLRPAFNAHQASHINLMHTSYPGVNSQPNPSYMAQHIHYPVHSVPMNPHVLPGQAFPGTASAHSQVPYQHTLPPTPQSQINMVQMQVGAPATSWTTGLFDCMDDPLNVLVTFFFPCVTFGQVAEIIDSGNTSCATSGFLYGAIQFFIGCPCLLSCTYRTKLRNKFNLYESPARDWITHFFCEPCALCQEYRELKNRDLDPSIGWQGNAAKWQNLQYQFAMMPPTHQAMRV